MLNEFFKKKRAMLLSKVKKVEVKEEVKTIVHEPKVVIQLDKTDSHQNKVL